jgi:hypothetical protein
MSHANDKAWQKILYNSGFISWIQNIVPYFIILLGLTLDNFTHQRENATCVLLTH